MTLALPAPPAADDLAAFDRDSYLIIRNAISPDLREKLAAASERLLASDRTAGRDRSTDGKNGFRGVVAMDDAFLPLVANPAVLPTLVGLLSCNLHLMSSNLIYMPFIPAYGARTITRTLDEVIGLQFSYSYSSPAQLGPDKDAFERDLREALTALNPSGRFDELTRTEAIIATRP